MQTIDKIFVDPDDEIIFVVEKILKAATSRVILVIPASSGVVSSVISLKLLSRQLLDSEKLMVLVTDNPTGKKLAVKAGLVVRDKISMVDKLAWDEALTIKKELLGHKDSIRSSLLSARVPEAVAKEPEIEEEVEEVEMASTEPVVEKRSVKQDDRVDEIFSEKPRLKPKVVEVGGIPIVSGGDVSELETPEVLEEVPTSTAPKVTPKTEAPEKDVESKITNRRLKPTGAKPNRKELKKVLIIFGLVLLALALISGGAFAYSYTQMSKVEIVVDFNQSEGSVNEVITVSTLAKEVDGENLIIPGYSVTVEDSSSADGSATGKKETGEFAQGLIEIRNMSEESALNLSAGQIVIDTTTNLRYELVENTVIPVDDWKRGIPIKAKEFGVKYNTDSDDSLKFRIEGFAIEQVFGYVFDDIRGGTTEEITTVTAEDVNKSKGDLETAIKGNLTTKLQSEIKSGEELLEGSEKFEEVEFKQSVKTDEEAEEFTVDLKMKVTAIKLVESDVEELAKAIIKKSESATDEAEIKVEDFEIKNIKVDGSNITFELSASGEVNENLKLDEQKDEIAGKSLPDAKSHLESLEQIESVEITYSPSYIPENWRKVPSDPERIKFK